MIRLRERCLGRLHVAKAASCEILYQSRIILPIDFLPFDLNRNVVKDVRDGRVESFPVATMGLEMFMALRLSCAHICNRGVQ